MKRFAHLSKWLSLAALLLLALSCFMPWAWYADLGKSFTGFFSERNIYGKPGKLLLILGAVTTACAFIPRIWTKRVALFTTALNLAYAVKTFIIYASCYGGYCPQKKAGLWLMAFSAVLLFLASLFPEGVVPQKREGESQPA
jgi:hypothetical protein